MHSDLLVNLLEAVHLRWGATAAADVERCSMHLISCVQAYNSADPQRLFRVSEKTLVHKLMNLAHAVEVARGWRDASNQWTDKPFRPEAEDNPPDRACCQQRVQAVFHDFYMRGLQPQLPKRPSKPPARKGTALPRPSIILINLKTNVHIAGGATWPWLVGSRDKYDVNAASFVPNFSSARVTVETFLEQAGPLDTCRVQCFTASKLQEVKHTLPNFALAGMAEIMEELYLADRQRQC